jgi:hypothetical protein
MASMSEKIAVVPPMPSASENAATIANAGFRASRRMPNRRSVRRSENRRINGLLGFADTSGVPEENV